MKGGDVEYKNSTFALLNLWNMDVHEFRGREVFHVHQ